jgi:hypothetical protein
VEARNAGVGEDEDGRIGELETVVDARRNASKKVQNRSAEQKRMAEVHGRLAEKGNAHIFVLSHVPESGHGAPILWVVSED